MVRYAWFFYEREDQVENLLESLNIKGQRERKLHESLKKVKDRLKLKKGKRAQKQPVARQNGDEMTMTERQTENANENATSHLREGTTDHAMQEGNQGADGSATVREEGAALSRVQSEVGTKQVDMTNEEESKTVLEDVTRDQVNKSMDNGQRLAEADETVLDPQDSSEAEDENGNQIRRVMFETDSWEDCITEAVWFGQKIPQKRRQVGRQAAFHKDPIKEFFED